MSLNSLTSLQRKDSSLNHVRTVNPCEESLSDVAPGISDAAVKRMAMRQMKLSIAPPVRQVCDDRNVTTIHNKTRKARRPKRRVGCKVLSTTSSRNLHSSCESPGSLTDSVSSGDARCR